MTRISGRNSAGSPVIFTLAATINGNKEVCQLLIEKGADVNASDLFGSTALMIAASNGHKEVCQLLIDNGADVNAVEKGGRTSLMLAAENENKEVVEQPQEKAVEQEVKAPTEEKIVEAFNSSYNKRKRKFINTYLAKFKKKEMSNYQIACNKLGDFLK